MSNYDDEIQDDFQTTPDGETFTPGEQGAPGESGNQGEQGEQGDTGAAGQDAEPLEQNIDFLRLMRAVQIIQSHMADLWPLRTVDDDPAAATGTIELVAATTDGGSGTAPADFTYAFTPADGVARAGVVPDNARDDVDLLAGGFGLFQIDSVGTENFVILDECRDYSACSGSMDGGSP